jgi:nucleoid-associated protein YgaU
MPRRTKVLVIAFVLMVGVIAAFVFRKNSATVADAPIAAVPSPAPPDDLRPLPEKPAPTSHLTGRIEPPDNAANVPSPGAGRGDSTTFGFSAAPTGGSAFSMRPPLDEYPTGGAATADKQFTSPASASGASYGELSRHKVIDGDTLSGLALKYLGSADRYREIYELNRDILASPDLLPIGTEVRIPAVGPAVRESASPSTRPMVPVAPRNRAERRLDVDSKPPT